MTSATDMKPALLSRRAQRWSTTAYGLMDGMRMAMERPFHLERTPEGVINLGTAENELMFEELRDKVGLKRV